MTPARPFSRLAVLNRGEPAMRAIHAVRELNGTRGAPITVIALATEAEREAMFVRHADESFVIGPATVTGPDGSRRNGYLDFDAVTRALRAVRADAVWPGWGFVAESPEFAELCERLGIVFVGPDAQTMRRLGDKIEAKLLAQQAGLPMAPWSEGAVTDLEHARQVADRIGYPLMVKAAAGGGGRGIRRVASAEHLRDAYTRARAEALEAFGDDRLLLERLVEPARHVEVQVIADGQGTAWSVGVRDCSCQRRHQKVIEESSSPRLTVDQEHELCAAARRLALMVGYRGAATVEFLHQPQSESLAFMEVNTRLQVEHPVTEAVTGLDLVKLQLHIAAGGRLEGEPPRSRGHAVEARLYAEDPALGFRPTPGRVLALQLPSGPGVRVDRGVDAGDLLPAEFDPMIAKLIAWGGNRDEAFARLRRALAETVAVVENGTTNRGFLLRLLDLPELRSGELDTAWLDRQSPADEAGSNVHAHVALLIAAIDVYDDALAMDRAHFYAMARRGRPQASVQVGRDIELRLRDDSYRLHVDQLGCERYVVMLDGLSADVHLESLGRHERRMIVGGRSYRARTSVQGGDLLVEVDGVAHRVTRDDLGIVRSHAPAMVVDLPVAVGDHVAAGDAVAVLESMKMEMTLTAPVAGRIGRMFVERNVYVEPNAALLKIEPSEDSGRDRGAQRIGFGELDGKAPDQAPGAACEADLDTVERLVLGYDIEEAELRRVIDDFHGVCADLACSPALIPGEHRLLTLYADLRELTRPQHDESDAESDLLRSPQEHFHAYLRSLDAEVEGLSPQFVDMLRRALAHYGVTSLDRSSALEVACHRMFLAQQRTPQARSAMVAILERRLEQADLLAGQVGTEFRDVLDRVEAASENRDPVLADLARELRYRYYDRQLVRAAAAGIYLKVEGHLRALAADPARDDRAERVRALVECPQVLAPILTRRMAEANAPLRRLLLEAMTRRYYRVRNLTPLVARSVAGVQWALSSYDSDEATQHVAAAFVELHKLAPVLRSLAACAAALPRTESVAADLYVHDPGVATTQEMLLEAGQAALQDAGLPPNVRRVVLAVTRPERGRGMSAIDLLTFVRRDGAWDEDEDLRGLHPEMGQRLQLWRLAEFRLQRLPSVEDVYLFRGVARANPRDERLFALAEVRDLTPAFGESGELIALPELERMLVQALEAVRSVQARRALAERPLWNRVLLHCWPTIDVDLSTVHSITRRYARTSGYLGIEAILVNGRVPQSDGQLKERVLRFSSPSGHGVVMEIDDPPSHAIRPLDEGARRIVQARRRGLVHPAEVVRVLGGQFIEHDLDDRGCLAPVQRPTARNVAGIVVGTTRAVTDRYPEGMLRVALLGDPTKALGSLAEPECRRIIAALDLAGELGVPAEWFAISAGAKIAMDSGTENMDWIAGVLRRIIEFTQNGGELNVIVTGVNVGAQPYWNAEATMLMHTRGILVMTPASSMVLTGKQALDYSGGVSAEDNFGIGGYERIMGPNGEAQYWASDLDGACRILLAHYEHCYVAPGERFPRRGHTADPSDRDVCDSPHHLAGSAMTRVGDIFSARANPGRKHQFDIRSVMRATIDSDHAPIERWATMADAKSAVVWDAHLGGWPVLLLGFESHSISRHGELPADGPERWTSGTLFPRSSKKVARAINAAGGRRPVVVLANLAGFDGSPESMREWQLEFGAEIGRAVVNYGGPIVFCVISRYHGGAFVVFSQALNPRLEAIAVQGARASVIGGAPAAAVVFARDVQVAARQDRRIVELDERIAAATGAERQRLRAERAVAWEQVHSEKLGEFAARFDAVHSVERAVSVGSVSRIIEPASLRPYLISAVERGIKRIEEQERAWAQSAG